MEGAVNRDVRTKAGAVVVAMLTLAMLSSRASPGFPLADVPKSVGRSIAKALGAQPEKKKATPKPSGQRGASSFALSDIPRRYLSIYGDAASECRALTWQVLAAIGKIESDHGRSSAPGVRSGVNHPQWPAEHLGHLGHWRARPRLRPGPRGAGGGPQAVR
jgi:hypothetical protein